jgi:3-oxoacyl-[acyl-carrier-protein] synthase III
MRAAITATGHHVPPDVYSNAHFESRLDTTDEWIRSRTGITERRFATTLALPTSSSPPLCAAWPSEGLPRRLSTASSSPR